MFSLKTTARKLLRNFGYDLRKVPHGYDPKRGFVLYNYCKSDGNFDLGAYRRIQTEGNKQKLHQVWVIEENIQLLAGYLKRWISAPRFGLCHGTRRGLEQAWFRKYLPGCEVIGTEISDTATQFPHTLQWDFHEVKDEWLGNVDFIYSNAFDHSYDPERCLNAWMSCVKPGGVCILEHSSGHGQEKASQLDPFGAELVQMPYLIAKWGQGRYCVREILQAPQVRAGAESMNYLIICKF